MPRTISTARTLFQLLLMVTLFIPLAYASGGHTVGSGNTVTADPNVIRPSTKPCVVQLFSGAQFFESRTSRKRGAKFLDDVRLLDVSLVHLGEEFGQLADG